MYNTKRRKSDSTQNETQAPWPTFIIAVSLFSSSAMALGVLPASTFDATRALQVKERSQGIEIPVSDLIPLEVEMDEISQEDIAAYIPMQIPEGSDGSAVANKILNRSLKTISRRITEKNKGLAKATESLQNLETNVTFGSTSTDKTALAHKVSFRLDAFETVALVKYRGVVEADLSFDIAGGQAALQIQQELGRSLNLSLMQNISKSDSRSYLQIQFQY